MDLKVKSFRVSAAKSIVFIHSRDARKLQVRPGERVALTYKEKEAIAVVDVVDSFFAPGEIGVSKKIRTDLELIEGLIVSVVTIPVPKSTQLIRKKLAHGEFSYRELKTIIKDIVSGALSDAEIAYFVSSVHHCGLSLTETVYLTRAIYETGQRLKWGNKIVVDKHSIGGIPGNRTTPIVVAICAAAGLIMPKTSSRAITSAAGTADTVESIARVDFPLNELRSIVQKTNACLAWGGSLGLAPADDKLIRVEKLLHLDPEPQLLASIMSKKLSVGSTHVLIDIPYGPTAKVTRSKALELKKKFEYLARHFKLKLKVVLTDGSQPIGNGVGPMLEMRDVIAVLSRHNGPKDLERKSVFLAGEILELAGKARKGNGGKKAQELLDSLQALASFKQIIHAQHGSLNRLRTASHIHLIKATRAGTVKNIDNRSINYLARLAGAPQDKAAGILLLVHKRTKVKKGDVLLEIHSESPDDITQALEFFQESKPITFA